jgi:hypothetical protein
MYQAIRLVIGNISTILRNGSKLQIQCFQYYMGRIIYKFLLYRPSLFVLCSFFLIFKHNLYHCQYYLLLLLIVIIIYELLYN